MINPVKALNSVNQNCHFPESPPHMVSDLVTIEICVRIRGHSEAGRKDTT